MSYLEVQIPQNVSLEEAKRFYEFFFLLAAEQEEDGAWVFHEYHLRIAHHPIKEDRSRYAYKKGKTPRRGLIIDDLDKWERRAIEAGAEAVSRLCDGREVLPGVQATYVWLKDPFGHIWTLRDKGDFQQKSTQPPQPRVVPERQKIEAKRAERKQKLEAKKE